MFKMKRHRPMPARLFAIKERADARVARMQAAFGGTDAQAAALARHQRFANRAFVAMNVATDVGVRISAAAVDQLY